MDRGMGPDLEYSEYRTIDGEWVNTYRIVGAFTVDNICYDYSEIVFMTTNVVRPIIELVPQSWTASYGVGYDGVSYDNGPICEPCWLAFGTVHGLHTSHEDDPDDSK